jgi:hypothetical protein
MDNETLIRALEDLSLFSDRLAKKIKETGELQIIRETRPLLKFLHLEEIKEIIEELEQRALLGDWDEVQEQYKWLGKELCDLKRF